MIKEMTKERINNNKIWQYMVLERWIEENIHPDPRSGIEYLKGGVFYGCGDPKTSKEIKGRKSANAYDSLYPNYCRVCEMLRVIPFTSKRFIFLVEYLSVKNGWHIESARTSKGQKFLGIKIKHKTNNDLRGLVQSIRPEYIIA